MHNEQLLTLKMKVKVTKINIHNCAIQRWISTSASHMTRFFAISRTVSVMCTFQICNFHNLIHDHRVQDSQWSHSMANIKLYKSPTWAFFASSHRFRNIHISKFVTSKCRSRSWCSTFAVAQCDDVMINTYLPIWCNSNACSISHHSRDKMKCLKCDLDN